MAPEANYPDIFRRFVRLTTPTTGNYLDPVGKLLASFIDCDPPAWLKIESTWMVMYCYTEHQATLLSAALDMSGCRDISTEEVNDRDGIWFRVKGSLF